MRFARSALMMLWMLPALNACARSEPVPADPDEVEAAIKQASEAADRAKENEAAQNSLRGG